MSSKFIVTLQSLRKAGACYEGYNKVVRSLQGKPFSNEDSERTSYIRFSHKEPISLLSILESNGLDDALWALRCVEGVDRDARLYAVWCARQVGHLMDDPRSNNAIDIAERHAKGLATDDELTAARAAAWAAARDVAWAAARDVAWAAAYDAAYDAARDVARAAAWAAEGAAAYDAARDAAWAAEGAAAYDAASDAARDAAWAAQKEMLIKMCNNQAPWQV